MIKMTNNFIFISKSSVVALKRFYKTKLETTRALQLEVKAVEYNEEKDAVRNKIIFRCKI
jgi:hypothetical protein